MHFRTPESIHRLSLKKSLSYKITNLVGTVRNRTLDSIEPFNKQKNILKMERVNLQELPKDERKLCRRWSEIKFSFLWISNIYALLTRHCCIFPNKKCTTETFLWSQVCQFFPQARIILFPSNCSQRSVLHQVQILPEPSQRFTPKCQYHANEFHMQMSSSVNMTKLSCYSSSVTQEKQGSYTTYVTFYPKPLLST